MIQRVHSGVLKEGYRLHWYEIKSVLGQGAFGITYLARDQNLNRLVAVKEYFPKDFASRDELSTVHPSTGEHRELYEWGLDRFVKEAQVLAQFSHPNIVRVYSVFEHNATAYMIMEYEHGRDLSALYDEKKRLQEQQLLDIFLPVLDGLKGVHQAGFIHRDIKPSNIYLREDATPVLIDFGAARKTRGAASQALTSLVTYGYAPIEQHNENDDAQGPWTDIYALGACLYLAVGGKLPETALVRGSTLLDGKPDPYQPLSFTQHAVYSETFVRAIDHALMFRAKDRPQDLQAWIDMLEGRPQAEALNKDDYAAQADTVLMPDHPPQEAPTRIKPKTVKSRNPAQKPPTKRYWMLGGLGALAVSVIAGGYSAYQHKREEEAAQREWEQMQHQARIDELQSKAWKANMNGDFLEPPGQSAAHYYQEILWLDPGNQNAEDNINIILDVYIESIINLLDKGKLDEAQEDYQLLAAALPGRLEVESIGADVERQIVRKRKIDALLEGAWLDAQAERYTAPAGENALEKLREVLKLAPDNAKALFYIEEMLDIHAKEAERSIREKRFSDAKTTMNEIAKIDAEARVLEQLRVELAKALSAGQER